MNGGALFADQWQEMGRSGDAKPGAGAVPEGCHDQRSDGILAAVGGTSLICYLLINRLQNRSARRQGAPGDSAGRGTSYDSGSDGWSIFSWFSSDTSSSDPSGASGDWGGSDDGTGGGGDSGGGGGDGGGGGN